MYMLLSFSGPCPWLHSQESDEEFYADLFEEGEEGDKGEGDKGEEGDSEVEGDTGEEGPPATKKMKFV